MLVAAFAAAPASAATTLASVSGNVLLFHKGNPKPETARAGMRFAPSDRLHTPAGASAELLLQDGTKIQVGPNSEFTLDTEDPGAETTLGAGTLRALIKNVVPNRFKVRTPNAVAAVRGTDFRVTVDDSGHSTFDLYSGLLGVGDLKGNEKLIKPGERISVDETGLGQVVPISKALQREQQERSRLAHREVGLDQSKEQVLAAAAQEIKLAEYQQGKAIIDVFGDRVRLEQYILRPRPDQFKLVVLNERTSRFDYFFYLGTFNQTLPTDLSLALSGLSGTPFTAPTWYLTAYETGRSNTQDNVHEVASGGHPVDLNHNADPNDNVTQYFDAKKDVYVNLNPGDPFYQTLFDNYAISYNNLTTFAWAGTNIQSMRSVVRTYYGGSGNYILDTDYPEFPILHQRLRESYGNGTVFDEYDNFLVNDSGTAAQAGDFNGVIAGSSYRQTLLKWNFEQVITSSQFGGRRIDLVIEPKTLIQSGLVQ